MKRYVRYPGPGEMRGEGQWIEFPGNEEDWQYLQKTGYMPTAWADDQFADRENATMEKGVLYLKGFAMNVPQHEDEARQVLAHSYAKTNLKLLFLQHGGRNEG